MNEQDPQKSEQSLTFDWEKVRLSNQEIKSAFWKQGEFSLRASVLYDTDYGWGVTYKRTGDVTAFRGRFTDLEEEGAIENPNYAIEGNRVFQYFVPAYSEALRVKDLMQQDPQLSEEEATHQAHEQVLDDVRIAADPEGSGYIAVGVTVTVFFRDIELAEASVWGTETDDTDSSYIDELTREEAAEALIEAEEKLAELRQP